MNPEVKTLWLDALRSGEYEQATGQLCENGKYCCLGVLTDLAVNNGIVQWDVSVFEHDAALAEDVREWADLTWDDPRTDEPYGDRDDSSLATLNDLAGYTFSQIADVIERDL